MRNVEVSVTKRYLATGFFIVLILVSSVLIIKKTQAVSTAIQAVDAAKTKGPANAKIQIVQYSDFGCPACRRVEKIINWMFQAYPNQVRFTYRHYPLAMHPNSKIAHQAAECAAMQNQFWNFHDRLYADQENWTKLSDCREKMKQYAKEFGLDENKFSACLADDTVTKRVYDEKAEGEKLKIQATPSFLINGQRFVGLNEFETKGAAMIRNEMGKDPLVPQVRITTDTPAPNPQTVKPGPMVAQPGTGNRPQTVTIPFRIQEAKTATAERIASLKTTVQNTQPSAIVSPPAGSSAPATGDQQASQSKT
ncbi:MAG: thioredoxin domain-containing protein [Candidatus Omnitrophica bacterium]|nr:thioredoxin domain-containing protein [Candidatus Omnitrophota bacterium]MDD5671024.1 thioredoxin domain-containing protein [Candidatus Omnitrophota bacterium]